MKKMNSKPLKQKDSNDDFNDTNIPYVIIFKGGGWFSN